MSDNVLKFKQPPVRGTAKRPVEDRFYCRTCNGERWYFSAKGDVECVFCGSYISNLRVVRT